MNYHIDDLKTIEKRLDDAQSRDYYYGIIQYNLTGQYGYLHDALRKYEPDTGLTRLIEHNRNTQVDDIVIFGAGHWGEKTYRFLSQFNINILCFFDNDEKKQGTEPSWGGGIKIQRPAKLREGTKYIVSSLYREEIVNQLAVMEIPEEDIIIYFEKIGDQYFDQKDIMSYVKEDCVFIDGGSFNGRNTIDFMTRIKPNCRKAILFEPEEENIQLIKVVIEKEGASIAEIAPFGMWDKRDTLLFKGMDSRGYISDEGSTSIEVISLDEYLDGEEANFIKMDIEGAELEALQGCKKTIEKYKPVLAICTYHKREDIIVLLKYILELNPDYRLRLRMYTPTGSESVVYAY